MIVDDDPFFRAGLRDMLESEGVEVVGEARTAEEALGVVARASPDVILMGMVAPFASDGELTRRITVLSRGARVVALTDTADPNEVMGALAAGACAYLAKDESVEAIATGIVRAAAAGHPLLSATTTRLLIDRVSLQDAARADGESLRAALSQRELEVLELIVEGKDNPEIAAALCISPLTVKAHVATILRKFGVQNRLQAAVRAVRAGLA